MAIDCLEVDVGVFDGVVEATAKHTAAESSARTNDMGVAFHLTRIAAAHEVHHRVARIEVFVFLVILDVKGRVDDARTLRHLYVQPGVALDDGVLSIAAAEYAEVRRTYLIEYFLPFVAGEEVVIFLCCIRQYLCCFVKQALFHIYSGVAATQFVVFISLAYSTSCISTTVDVVVDLELLGGWVVLWRVGVTTDDGGWLPESGAAQPICCESNLASSNVEMGVARYVCRGDGLSFLAIVICGGADVAPSAAKGIVVEGAVMNAYVGVAIDGAVFTTAIDAVEGMGFYRYIACIIRMLQIVYV